MEEDREEGIFKISPVEVWGRRRKEDDPALKEFRELADALREFRQAYIEGIFPWHARLCALLAILGLPVAIYHAVAIHTAEGLFLTSVFAGALYVIYVADSVGLVRLKWWDDYSE